MTHTLPTVSTGPVAVAPGMVTVIPPLGSCRFRLKSTAATSCVAREAAVQLGKLQVLPDGMLLGTVDVAEKVLVT